MCWKLLETGGYEVGRQERWSGLVVVSVGEMSLLVDVVCHFTRWTRELCWLYIYLFPLPYVCM